MAAVLFSSWQGEVVDNRGKAQADCVAPARLTVPEEFGKTEQVKAFMGWDGFALLDAGVDIVDMSTQYVAAVQKESCGRCIPCRVGTRIIFDVMTKISEGKGSKEDLARITGLADYIKQGSKCQIGQTGLVPLLDAIKYFGDAFDAAISQGVKAIPGNYRVSVTAPCMSVCPTKLNIPHYVEQIAECSPGSSLWNWLPSTSG